MPNKSAAAKSLRQNVKARARNKTVANNIKKLSVQLRKAYAAKDPAKAKSLTMDIIRAYDKAAQKKVIHPRNAARKKSRLMARLKKTS